MNDAQPQQTTSTPHRRTSIRERTTNARRDQGRDRPGGAAVRGAFAKHTHTTPLHPHPEILQGWSLTYDHRYRTIH